MVLIFDKFEYVSDVAKKTCLYIYVLGYRYLSIFA